MQASKRGEPDVCVAPDSSSPLARMVEQVQVVGRTRLSGGDESMAVHLKDEDGAVLVSFGVGDGILFVLSEPEIISNAKLTEADNAAFAYGLARWQASEGVVTFDEFHHGFSDAPTLGSAMRRSAAGWGIYQAVLAALVLVLSRTLRFGAPIPVFTRRRRSALEYVRSLASLYRAAAARRKS